MGSIVNGITDAVGLSNHSGNAAFNAQEGRMGQANAALTDAYKNQQTYLNPYNQAGVNAVNQLGAGNLVTASTLANDPSYQFMLDEGLKAVNSNAVARGMGNSGAAQKELLRYGQNYASQAYDKAYNREYTRLSDLAGLGSNAANNLASASGSLGANLANNYTGLGNAQAANYTAAANRMANTINTGVSAAAMAFSDKRIKQNIYEIDKSDLLEMKKYLKAYAFNYINDDYGKGDWIGVMAQDLEKSKLGRTLVVENEKGEKMIDIKKVLSMFLATMAEA